MRNPHGIWFCVFNHGDGRVVKIKLEGVGSEEEATTQSLALYRERLPDNPSHPPPRIWYFAPVDVTQLSSPRVLINCDATPYFPSGWTVEEHHKGGQIEFDPKRVILHLDPAQTSATIQGHDLRKKLASKPVMNACVLDHLLANPHLIPKDWKQDEQGRIRCIFFWGSVYRDSGGDLDVRYLYWCGGRWHWNCTWLDNHWDDQGPAALLAS